MYKWTDTFNREQLVKMEMCFDMYIVQQVMNYWVGCYM